MSQEDREITYDECYSKPFNERKQIFGSVTTDNRALLIKTHAERWLGANRLKLTPEQVELVEELISSISPKWYETGRGELEPEVEVLVKRIEAALSREDVRQLATAHAEYIPLRF
jgi:hypothetical protein